MSFETDQVYSDFKLIKKEFIRELKSQSLFFKHEGNGAEVLVLENDDDNKVFSVAFRTPPENDRKDGCVKDDHRFWRAFL